MPSGWLSLSGGAIVAAMLLPNLLDAARGRGGENLCKNRWMNALEQIGRYGSMLFMVWPVGGGFGSKAAWVAWTVLCLLLTAGYLIVWIPYFRHPARPLALALAILPSLIFILRGAFLRCVPLALCGALFAVGHIDVTDQNHGGGRAP